MIADFLGGEVVGDQNVVVNNLSKIDDGKEGTISFLSNLKYTQYIYDTKASIVLVNRDFVPEKEIKTTLIKVDNAYECLAKILQMYQDSKPKKQGIEPMSFVDESVKLPTDVYIGAFAYIGKNVKIGEGFKAFPHVYVGDNVKIGKNVTLNSGVKIYADCVIGDNVTIHSGTIIGADGFGFAPKSAGDYAKVPQIGNVVIENDVEIGANSTIDRATMGSTFIRQGVKLDNLIQVGHNCEIKENTVIAAQSGLAGSTTIGKNCMIGGQVGFAGHMTVADGCMFSAQTGIDKDVKNPGEILMGSPAMQHKGFYKSHIVFRKLPDIDNKIYQLEKQLKELQEKLNNQK